MVSFLVCVVFLVVGFLTYGKFVEKVFGPDDRQTPAYKINDGVDYIPMPAWKVFLIQLLNIAGTGPIFGALSGALFGPVVYLWIIFGCVFAGAVHDYMCGMLSMRHNGASISELTGIYLGDKMRQVMRVFSVILLVMCGVVFTTGPADLLALITPQNLTGTFWLWVILAYYLIATFVPIDKVIGKIYPLFGICLIVMAIGVASSLLFSGNFTMPELWVNFKNLHASNISIWPFMFITVACGAISGFHATQSPMMARCCKSEKQGRNIFYGAMIAEGVIALVWAAAGVSVYDSSQALLEAGGGCSAVVYNICQSTMGKIGSILAMVGVIICPISSGDTAYRSARLTLADWFKLDQADWKKRLFVTLPLLGAGALICQLDYSAVWRYFSWSNQTLAMIALWAISVYLYKSDKKWIISVVPAVFMSAVTTTYFFASDECMGYLWRALNINSDIYYPIAIAAGIIFAIICLAIYLIARKNIEVPNVNIPQE
ncbi:Carbon starvation protein CstA [Acetitomaculum ruminis DSM 5522]|uniref:Carbon starvation protein CstA n=1 Tax=Acetitomaculum ruminis DSM 5522 TaxID=1120918 RepID=A0A1I0Z7Z2_9FIRM|nr:carbon starvation protein A [Acetitomaculum ruminis]SFB21532.1 Carbon starvation protein CstA [Acetitomaculum ruminis DSM 5522]